MENNYEHVYLYRVLHFFRNLFSCSYSTVEAILLFSGRKIFNQVTVVVDTEAFPQPSIYWLASNFSLLLYSLCEGSITHASVFCELNEFAFLSISFITF